MAQQRIRNKKCLKMRHFIPFGSPTWARTRDLRINSPSLYRLSYQGIFWWILTGSNRRLSPCKGDTLPTELRILIYGAEYQNRTDDVCLEGSGFTIKLIPHNESNYTTKMYRVNTFFDYFHVCICSSVKGFSSAPFAQVRTAGSCFSFSGNKYHTYPFF